METEQREHILVVDDELHTRNSLCLILQSGGYWVSLAQNGVEALDMIDGAEKSGVSVDLILTDIQMPEMKGDTFLKIIKERGVSIPVIAMTGFGNTDMVDILMRHGCSGYLEKPFDDAKLFARIRKVLDEKPEGAGERKTASDIGDPDRMVTELYTYKKSLSRLREQIETAADVYQSLVKIRGENHEIEISWRNRPFAKLGGDFVDLGKTGNIYDIFMADVSGHDLSSSFHTILLKAFFEENCRKGNNGRTLFQLLNRHLLETGGNERMITALFVRIDLDRMIGEAVSAAHPPFIHLKGRSREVRPMSVEGDALGIYRKPECDVIKFGLEAGDRLFLQTDGVTGVSRLNGETGRVEKLKIAGLSGLIQKHGDAELEKSVDRIWEDLLDFAGQKPGDDMLLFAAEIPAND